MSLKNSTIQKEFEETLPNLRLAVKSYIRSVVTGEANVEDITQNTLMKVYESLDAFDPKKGDLYKFSLGTAYWQVRKFLTDYSRNRVVYDNSFLQNKRKENSDFFYNHRHYENHENLIKANQLIESCYKKLPKLNRLIAILYFKKDCSRKQICAITGRSMGYVGGTLHRIKQFIIKDVRSKLRPEDLE